LGIIILSKDGYGQGAIGYGKLLNQSAFSPFTSFPAFLARPVFSPLLLLFAFHWFNRFSL